MKESEGKRKEAATVERFSPKFINEPKRERSLLQCVQMAYIATKTSKINKLHELSLLHRG